MGTNLPESTDWFKLTNEILVIKGSIILCEVSILYKLHMLDDDLAPRAYCLSDMGWAPLELPKIIAESCSES